MNAIKDDQEYYFITWIKSHHSFYAIKSLKFFKSIIKVKEKEYLKLFKLLLVMISLHLGADNFLIIQIKSFSEVVFN